MKRFLLAVVGLGLAACGTPVATAPSSSPTSTLLDEIVASEPIATYTSGAIDPRVTQANIHSTICTLGYTRTVRPPVSYTEPLKIKQMQQYHRTGSLSGYEEDHLIPLELGGNPTDPRNLWPEPRGGVTFTAAMKDRLENSLRHKVCSGQLSLTLARQDIATDWVGAYEKYVVSGG